MTRIALIALLLAGCGAPMKEVGLLAMDRALDLIAEKITEATAGRDVDLSLLECTLEHVPEDVDWGNLSCWIPPAE